MSRRSRLSSLVKASIEALAEVRSTDRVSLPFSVYELGAQLGGSYRGAPIGFLKFNVPALIQKSNLIILMP